MPLPRVLKDMLSLPTAAFVESAVMEYVTAACSGLAGVHTKFDRYGNLLARYGRARAGATPVVFTAHTDHPGFVALRMLDARTVLAAFRGWVEPEYFPRTRVRFYSGGAWLPGRVEQITKLAPVYGMIGRTGRPEEVAVRVSRAVEPNSPGMWDLPDPYEKNGKVYARGCDDVAGCAAMLALLQRLSKKQVRGEAYCLFTRAEEVGFVGAIGAAKARTVPRSLPIVAIETSKALPNAPIGAGPILRVGDKTSVFTPDVTAFCDRVARSLAGRRKTFQYQRKLMDGGTCESTAYVAYGYAATGICLALGNYHNMNPHRRKIESEYVSLEDWRLMVDWFEALVTDTEGYGGETQRTRAGLEKRFANHLELLSPRVGRRQARGRGGRTVEM